MCHLTLFCKKKNDASKATLLPLSDWREILHVTVCSMVGENILMRAGLLVKRRCSRCEFVSVFF